MLFDLPDDDTLYAALLARDAAYDGRAYGGVSSTAVFCRLTCPARKPRRENCRFFDSVAASVGAGFRPCRRCHPMAPAARAEPVIATLLAAFDEAPGKRWGEADVAALGLDSSTVRRAFRRQFGMTFLDYARLSRLRDGFETLSVGGRVIDAQLDAGFSSPSEFRDAFARLLGAAPGDFRGDALLLADWIETPVGPMIAVADRHALHLLEFLDRKALPAELRRLRDKAKARIGIGRPAPISQVAAELGAFFAAERSAFSVPIATGGSAFARSVWQELHRIPAGETRSYAALARAVGRPDATRAVARANGANRLAIVFPCHRVIGADGSLTGYGGGLRRKQWLIELKQGYARKETA